MADFLNSTSADQAVGLEQVDEASGWVSLATFPPIDTAMPDLPPASPR